MVRLVRSVLCLLVVAVGGVAGAPPAQAASGSLSIASGVIWSDCRQYAFTYQLALDPGTTYWNLETRVLGPDGLEVSSDYIYSSAYPPSGTSSFQVCGGELPGRWSLVATMEYDVGDTSHTAQLPVAYFDMRLPKTVTTLKVSDKTLRLNQAFTFTVKVKDERPTGYFGTSYASVRLERRSSGKWVTVKGSRTATNEKGVAKLKFRWKTKGSAKVRAVTKSTYAHAGSVSNVLKLRNVR